MEDADLETVEQLCRLQLAARRLGCRMLVHDASDSLRTVITLAGLADILLADDAPRDDRPERTGPSNLSPRSVPRS